MIDSFVFSFKYQALKKAYAAAKKEENIDDQERIKEEFRALFY